MMQLIIPMSGVGKRFIEAGYTDPKPLIEVEGKPIVQHVIERFPGIEKISFICNEEHLQNTRMREILARMAPQGNVYSISPHKLGPVYAVMQIKQEIDDQLPAIVNYCDFSWRWNYEAFQEQMQNSQCDGCVVAYRGFHPHLLHRNLYASMRDDGHGNMLEIREKHSFTENIQDCFQSSGTYYFRTGKILKKYFQVLMDAEETLNGEYYVSMVFNKLVADGLNVRIFEIPTMLQWGTPADLEEYLYWSGVFLP